MTRFLEYIAAYLLEKHRDQLDNIAIVFPNRRAGLWFQHELSALTDRPVWSPAVFTIQSLIQNLTGRSITDTVLLVLELYGIWRETMPENPEESLDQFYRWGEMLLGDFDDMDKYLVHAGDLFRNLKSLRDIEMAYLNPEQQRLIQQFWDHFPKGEGSRESRAFSALWQHLEATYTRFRARLLEKDMAYEGMLYREVAEMADSGNDLLNQWDLIYFVGFHALTPAEEHLFTFARQHDKAAFFWDYDEAYLNHPAMSVHSGRDTGYFIRKYRKMFPPPEEATIFNNLLDHQKKVELYAMPSRTSQAAVGKELLEKWCREPTFAAEKTALVLADEQLLLPVVHAVPEEIKEMNITMGYPVRHTPLYGIFSLMMELHMHALRHSRDVRFHTGRIMEIIHHPLLGPILTQEWQTWGKTIENGNQLWINRSEIPEAGILTKLFSVGDHAPVLASVIIEILYEVILPPEPETPEEEQQEVTEVDGGINREAYYQLTLLVNRLNEALAGYREIWDTQEQNPEREESYLLYLKLLSQMAASIKIPFYGEPLAGLQVMGLLETRLIDFERVILFSVNEKSLPKGISSFNSFIPYNLRKGFGMPTFDHHDTVYNYYFLRLIQRAREVVLVYHTQVDDGQTGEISRFVPQLEYLLGLTPERKVFSFAPDFPLASRIVVEKDRELLTQIEKICANGLSPSALNTYIECPLRYYFRYVARIREPDILTVDVDQALIGSLFHKAMEIAYRPLRDQEVNTDTLEATIKKSDGISSLVREAFREILPDLNPGGKEQEGGLNAILQHAVRKFVYRTLSYDLSSAPFRITGLEMEVQYPLTLEGNLSGKKVKLAGKIDRLDLRGDTLYLIDYKTGTVHHSFNGVPSLFDTGEEKRNGAAFQILLYSWIIHQQGKKVIPQLYFLRNMFVEKPETYVFNEKEAIRDFSSVAKTFDHSLRVLVAELLNPDVAFEQTRIASRCRYCPYADICRDRV